MDIEKKTTPAYMQFFGWLLLVFTVAGLSSFIATSEVATWYKTIHKPVWTPPEELFGPVWTLLYFLMALSAFRISRSEATISQKKEAYSLFFFQLFLNGLWSVFFFGFHSISLSFLDLSLLIVLLSLTIIQFMKIDLLAGWLLVPYFVWSLYALTVNIALIYLNSLAKVSEG